MKTVIAVLVCCLLPLWVVDTARCNEDIEAIENFIASYHGKPQPARVSDRLGVALKLVSQEPLPFDAPNGPRLLANAFGYMARGQKKLVRLYESRFENTTKQGRSFLLEAMRICGDAATVKRLDKWAVDSRYAASKKEIEAARAFLANPRRQYPRDRAAKSPEDLDFLWADFLVTGDYAPVARILEVLEQPRSLRKAIEKRLKSPLPDPTEGRDVMASLKSFNLLEPNTKNRLVKGDLELVLLYNRRGRLRGDGFVLEAVVQDCFDLNDEDLVRAMLTHGAAAWSLQSNLEQHPRLAELLKAHYRDCKPRAQVLIKRWLNIDQAFQLSKEAKELQGTWQAFAEERTGDKRGPKLKAEILKYVRWTFDEDECKATKALTLNSTKVIGQGGTNSSTYEIDASKKPKRILLTSIDGDGWAERYPCIYKLEGDMLTVCMSRGKDYPKSFSAQDGIVTKLKKVKGKQSK